MVCGSWFVVRKTRATAHGPRNTTVATDPNKKVLDKLKTRIGAFREKVGDEVWQGARAEIADLFARFEKGQYYTAGGTVARIGASDPDYVEWKKNRFGYTERGWANGVLGFAIERAAILRRYPTGFSIDPSRVAKIRRYWKRFRDMKAPGFPMLRKGWRNRIAKRLVTKLGREINSIGELAKKIGQKPRVRLTLDHIVSGFRGPVGALAGGRLTRRRP